MTFGTVRSSILRLSGILLEANVQKGDRVILFGDQSPGWVISFFAILHRGAVVVPLDPNTSSGLLKDIYKRSELFFCNKEEAQVVLKTDEQN